MAASVVIAARQAQARREAAETPTMVDSEESGPSPARGSATSADAFVQGMSVLWEQSQARGTVGRRKGRAPNRRSNQFDKAASRLSRSQAASALKQVRASVENWSVTFHPAECVAYEHFGAMGDHSRRRVGVGVARTARLTRRFRSPSSTVYPCDPLAPPDSG